MLSSRTLISLSQFIALQTEEVTSLLLRKCGLAIPWAGVRGVHSILECLQASSPAHVREVLGEVCRSTRTLRNGVSPKYLYDERWTDLLRCLLLDGYHITGDYSSGYVVVTLDPTIEAVGPLDDDLTAELTRSNLRDRLEVIRLMKNSAEDFCKQPQDFNGALTSARVSLETLAKNIAEIFWTSAPMSGDPTKFGANIAYLRSQAGFLSQKEETGIAGVYAFVSPGAHVPVGLTEEEMVRLGRTMIAAMCYFLIKRYNG
jgi:hypothetical protein